MSDYMYDAFISYKNSPDNRKLAGALQRSLHGFSRPWNRLRAMRTYRDETNVAASPHLWEEIERALRASRHFLLLASPDAAASPWVQKELDWWLTERGSKGLLLGLVGGAIEFKSDLTIDQSRTTSLPFGLVGRFPQAPFYVDLRASAVDPKRQSMTHENFRTGVHKLSSAILGRPLDELTGEDIRQRRIQSRVLRTFVTALFVSVVGLIYALVVAHNANVESKRQAQVALLGQGRALASTSALAAELGDGTVAALYAATGDQQLKLRDPLSDRGNLQLADLTAKRQIESSQFKAQSLPFFLASFELPPRMLPAFDFNTDRLYVATDVAGAVVLDPAKRPDWVPVTQLNATGVTAVASDLETGKVAAITPNGIVLFDPRQPGTTPSIVTKRRSFSVLAFDSASGDLVTGLTIFRANDKWAPVQVTDELGKTVSVPDITHIGAARSAQIALVISRRAGSVLVDIVKAKVIGRFGSVDGSITVDGAINADGSLVALRNLNGQISVYRTENGEPLWTFHTNSGPGGIAFSKFGFLAVATAGEIQLLDVQHGSQRYRFTTGRPDDIAIALRFSSREDMLLSVGQSGHYEFFRFNLPSEVLKIADVTKDSTPELSPDASGRLVLGWTNDGSAAAIDLEKSDSLPVRWNIKEGLAAVVPGTVPGEWTAIATTGTAYRLSLASAVPQALGQRPANVKIVTGSVSDGSWAIMNEDGRITTSTGAVIDAAPETNQIVFDGHAGVTAALTDAGLKIWSHGTLGGSLVLERPVADAMTVVLSKDGKRAAVGCSNGDIYVYALDGLEADIKAHPHTAGVMSLMFDATGERLISVSLDGTKVRTDVKTGDFAAFESNHGMEAQLIAVNDDLGIVASSGEDGTILLNGLSYGGLLRRIAVENGRITAMYFSGRSLVFAVDDGSVRRIELNSLEPTSVDLLRLKVGRHLSADERATFGLSKRIPREAKKEACFRAFEKAENPYAALSGIIMDERDFRGQADICLMTAQAYPDEACWPRMAGYILRQSALSKEALGKRFEALGMREEAYVQTRSAAEKGCIDAAVDLLELGQAKTWAQGKLQTAASGGDGKAATVLSQIGWDDAKTEKEKQDVLQRLRTIGDEGQPWAMEKNASLLANEDLPENAEQIFHDSFISSVLFENCDISDVASDHAAALRALALANLDDNVAMTAVNSGTKVADTLLKSGICSRLQAQNITSY